MRKTRNNSIYPLGIHMDSPGWGVGHFLSKCVEEVNKRSLGQNKIRNGCKGKKGTFVPLP